MSFETINLTLFNELNASAHASHFIIEFAIFIANDLLYVLFAFLLFLWCYGDQALKERAIRAVTLTTFALCIGYFISLFYYHPRPFVMEIGRTLIEHRPSASFPSNHMLIFSTIGFSYLFAKRFIASAIFLLSAIAVAWSRVYLGVHFPLDMLGAFSIAFLVNVFGQIFWQRFGQILLKFFLVIYQSMFRPLLNKGLLK
ncbi:MULTISPECIES: undecaprenyl-diphosphatase [unclassified Acinetobacter]|uniref:undecaprenyl-diphosphatase n=1 Tax=unclassified Acinetobacter TaxID=196816 RepID=UPI00190E5DA9|nr:MULTISPECIES: undecaprenyl-diphosphatase [unclassified Acinetobacter]MBK0065235.1 undecaprenyl-diphosphatase [Acinetobacter sp. S55]MBK0068485.1 undecaprenyl-diphosphatase [Acinetobacter sp. S54]